MTTVKIDLTELNLDLTEREMLELSSLGMPVYEWKLYDSGKLIRHCKKFYKHKSTGKTLAYDEVSKKYIEVGLN